MEKQHKAPALLTAAASPLPPQGRDLLAHVVRLKRTSSRQVKVLKTQNVLSSSLMVEWLRPHQPLQVVGTAGFIIHQWIKRLSPSYCPPDCLTCLQDSVEIKLSVMSFTFLVLWLPS